MKGIVLAGGSGTSLSYHKGISKQLMPIYDKPMVYIRFLLVGRIKDILIISTLDCRV